jgi:hypothetical protein
VRDPRADVLKAVEALDLPCEIFTSIFAIGQVGD